MYLLGGYGYGGAIYADILEYLHSEVEEKWSKIEEMSKKRAFHAVSIIDFDKFIGYCQ